MIYIFNKKDIGKLQWGVLNDIEKFNKDKFNKRGSCKLLFPQIKFALNHI